MGNKKKTISMMSALLLTAHIPTTIAAFVIAAVGCVSMSQTMEGEIYHELKVMAQGLEAYYEWDIKNNENHMPI